MSDLVVSESFNLFVGDAGPNNSKHLIIKNLKIPEFEEITQAHHSGGSRGAITITGLGHKELMATFKLTGWDPQTMSQFGIGGRSNFPFTAYGNARSKATGSDIQIKAVMFGRMSKITHPEMTRGSLWEPDHEIHEILHYELWYDKSIKYEWTWKSGLWRVDGVVQNQDELSNLAIPL